MKEIKNKSEGAALAKLWILILNELGIVNRIPSLINRYVERESHCSLSRKKKSKSTITADHDSESMTWKVFLNLIFNVLRIPRIDFTITLYHPNGEKSIHTVKIDKRDVEYEDKKDDK